MLVQTVLKLGQRLMQEAAFPIVGGGASAAGIGAAGAAVAGSAETASRQAGWKYRSTRVGSRLRCFEISSAFHRRKLMRDA